MKFLDQQDRVEGRWERSTVPWDEIVDAAERLSAAHSAKGGHRSFDILHVAHAQVVSATAFLTFDANQLRLAKSAGLKT